MTYSIIYPLDSGSVAHIMPASDCGISVEEIARKDVPAGKPYLIVDDSNVPTDVTFFEAWEADFSNPHGFGIGPNAWFIEQYQSQIAAINAEPTPAQGEGQTDDEFFAVVGQWEQWKIARIAQLNTQIATQQAEMNA